MNGVVTIPLLILGLLVGAALLAAILFLVVTIFGLTWKVLGNVCRFIGSEFGDAMRCVGAVLSALLFAPLVVLNIVIGRWSASRHFAAAFWSEVNASGKALYRVFVGNPARLLGLGAALEGVERRVPQALAAAPGRDRPTGRTGQFEGYRIVGSLQGGGSGGRLYIAEPDEIKQAAFARQGQHGVDRVVIKAFSLSDGSSLPQIVRESRALDAAKNLGLVLEHELTPERFHYVMRYVPGDSLAVVTQRLHAESPAEGLSGRRLSAALGYACDLLEALDAYHRAGLWHKDVKPDNIIVDHNDHKAHLVDFGLVTPLRSAMTLTTHGTEYFRDPELVRQALRGVKVHQIDGSKFDVYAAGAVLYSVIENSFPAHGGLSQITKRCPEALRWIVRRAMTDYDRRYSSATEMLADLRVVCRAADPFALKPVDLPSVGGNPARADAVAESVPAIPAPPVPPTPPMPPFHPARPADFEPGPRGRPALTVTDWWSGRYTVVGGPAPRRAGSPVPPPPPARPRRPLMPVEGRRSAADQVREARARARAKRQSAAERIAARRGRRPSYSNGPTAGVVVAGLLGLAVVTGVVGLIGASTLRTPTPPSAPTPPAWPAAPASLPEVEARVLVVSDLALPLGESILASVSRNLDVLREQGVVLSGDLLPGQDERTIDEIASLRRDRGRLPIDSDQLPGRVRDWMRTRDVEGVLLLAPGTTPGEVRSVLIGRDFEAAAPWDDAAPRFLRLLDEHEAPGARSSRASRDPGKPGQRVRGAPARD